MNYAELVKTIKSYVENTFPNTIGTDGLSPTEQIDTIIKQAEQRIYNSANILDLRKNVNGTATPDNPYLSLPSDWLASYSVAAKDTGTGAYTFLYNKDVAFIRESFPDPTDTGALTHYALFDKDTMLLGPTPDAAYTIELHYFYYPESIVTASTTWIGDNFDTVLLYACLLEAYIFMKGEEDVLVTYKKQFDDAMGQLNTLADGKNRQDNFNTLQTKVPVV